MPTLLVARTDADAANLITSEIGERDQPSLTSERSGKGFFYVRPGLEQAIGRALSYAPYADMIWCETSHPDLGQAREFAQAIHARYSGKLLAYNCSPSFNWTAKLSQNQMLSFREELAELGYKFQFITLAGFHALNMPMFELALAYNERGMAGDPTGARIRSAVGGFPGREAPVVRWNRLFRRCAERCYGGAIGDGCPERVD